MILAGFPPTTTLSGTSFFVITAPDAITTLSPTVIPRFIIASNGLKESKKTLFPN
jgi:hypothetical protein